MSFSAMGKLIDDDLYERMGTHAVRPRWMLLRPVEMRITSKSDFER